MNFSFDTEWYNSLKKSPITPPPKFFGIVWGILYFLIGLSGIIFFLQNGFNEPIGLTLFFVQLFFNIMWSYVFFGQKNIAGGLLIILVLWALILLTIVQFYQTSPVAAFLLIPYFLWVTVALYLNAYIYVNN